MQFSSGLFRFDFTIVSMAKLCELPGELLGKIFANLPRVDRYQCLYVNRSFNLSATPFAYEHLYIFDLSAQALCLELFTKTALNRKDKGRQSEYSKRDYCQYVRSIKWCTAISCEDVLALARHCPNLEAFETGTFGLHSSCIVDDDWLENLYRSCPKLKHVDFHRGRFSPNALNDHTYELCRQLVSLNFACCLQIADLSPSLSLSNLSQLIFEVRTPHSIQQLRSFVTNARNSITTLAIRWYVSLGPADRDSDITQLLLDCPNLKTLALEWAWLDPCIITRFPTKINNLQLIARTFSGTDHLMDALLQTSNLQQLHIFYFDIPEDHLRIILNANGETLKAFTYIKPAIEPVTESCLQACKNLKSLHISPIRPEKGGGKLGKFISKRFRDQLESFAHAYDEPCFWGHQWPNVKSLTVSMKRRHTTTKAGVERLIKAFPNVEYLKIECYDKGIISFEEWKHFISQFRHLKGIFLPGLSFSHSRELYFKGLRCVYEEWATDPHGLSEYCYPAEKLISFSSLA